MLNEPTLLRAIQHFGETARAKLSNPVAAGAPEDQLRAPFESLLAELASLIGFGKGKVVAVGETSLSDLGLRPDYSIIVQGALVGFIELKAPGKGADPRRFKGEHDKAQWRRLQALPNLIYCDGNSFSLWQNGELSQPIVRLNGDIEVDGPALAPGPGLLELFSQFLGWQPIPPRTARELAEVTARLCRLLRDEVADALTQNSPALTTLATDWRHLLFPMATDKQFADGYAQAVTFGLLMARARGISLDGNLHKVAQELCKTSSLIGTALQLLTDSADTRSALGTSLTTLERVLEAVSWPELSRGQQDAWLYFYEEFLQTYDNTLRKQTGSYYTPAEVVQVMVRLTDDVLKSPGFSQPLGLASPAVTVADPATGTGTFMLGVLRHIAQSVKDDQGAGAVAAAIEAALKRLVAFELQLGPFAVAQLRVMAEVLELIGRLPRTAPRMFVTDTLASADDDGGHFPGFLAAIGQQRREANRVKREETLTVVIGNPPYKEKAMGRGGWVEGVLTAESPTAQAATGDPAHSVSRAYAPLDDWQPPKAWGVGSHAKHLRNLYIYFWRWASWKVFDRPREGQQDGQGIVCFITVAGFLSGPGFQRMREDLRQRCDAIWVIDASPEGHQPEASTRIFQGVQQPVCIVLAARWRKPGPPQGAEPSLAVVRWASLPLGHRKAKFEALQQLRLDSAVWMPCPQEGRAPFLPASSAAWAQHPLLENCFEYDGSGVMPGRTWVIAPDAESLVRRWQTLTQAPAGKKAEWFHPHLVNGKPGDKHVDRRASSGLPGFPDPQLTVAQERSACAAPVRYGFRSFDRQWILPDARLLNRPNPRLWAMRSDRQVYLTAPHDRSPEAGAALTATSCIPDLHHYNGRGGRVYPLWADADATLTNLYRPLLAHLAVVYGDDVGPEELLAYIVALTAHPGYVERFRDELSTPGLRIPLTADADCFRAVAALGKRVVWLHTFGERMADPAAGRPAAPPRLPVGRRPVVPAQGAIPADAQGMPDTLAHDASTQTLHIGQGRIAPVPAAVWHYEVSGKQVLRTWFSYRRKSRERPLIGERRKPSPLGDIQPESWPAEYTSDLLDLLNVLGMLVDLEPQQADLLCRVMDGPTLSVQGLVAAGALPLSVLSHAGPGPTVQDDTQSSLF